MGKRIKNDPQIKFEIEHSALFKNKNGDRLPIANFHVIIRKQLIIEGEEGITRQFEIKIKMPEKEIPFTIPVDDFLSRKLETKILETAGHSAIILGSIKDVRLAAQILSKGVPEEIIREHGFDKNGIYFSNGMAITPSGVKKSDIRVDTEKGEFSRYLGFLHPDSKQISFIGSHLHKDFLELKDHAVTFPLMGCICLAPFASLILHEFDREKVAMVLIGASGGGKTFLTEAAISFYGQFEGRLPSWSSTANFLEAEGYFFKDALFVIDDYKEGVTPQESVVRIFQNYSGGHGRGRLKSNARLQSVPYIRGLLLSNGEDFVDVESVSGRAIRIFVEPEKNVRAGELCKKNSHLYRTFTPGLIHWVISKPDWKARAKAFIDEKTQTLHKETMALSNGLRIASNWALTALGFDFFLGYSIQLGVINRGKKEKMAEEYMGIVRAHLKNQMETLREQNPVEVFFRVIGQKLQTNTVCISGLKGGPAKGKVIGQLKGRSVMIFPEIALEVLVGHFRSLGQRMPFGRNSLRDALAQSNLIGHPKKGRWSKQYRGEDKQRHNAWEFDKKIFEKKTQYEES